MKFTDPEFRALLNSGFGVIYRMMHMRVEGMPFENVESGMSLGPPEIPQRPTIIPGFDVLTLDPSNNPQTYTIPTDCCFVWVVGAGGGGGGDLTTDTYNISVGGTDVQEWGAGGASGGGGGGCALGLIINAQNVDCDVTIGAGGAGGTTDNDGTDGGDTTFARSSGTPSWSITGAGGDGGRKAFEHWGAGQQRRVYAAGGNGAVGIFNALLVGGANFNGTHGHPGGNGLPGTASLTNPVQGLGGLGGFPGGFGNDLGVGNLEAYGGGGQGGDNSAGGGIGNDGADGAVYVLSL